MNLPADSYTVRLQREAIAAQNERTAHDYERQRPFAIVLFAGLCVGLLAIGAHQDSTLCLFAGLFCGFCAFIGLFIKPTPRALPELPDTPYGDAHFARPDELATLNSLTVGDDPTGTGNFLGFDPASNQPIFYTGDKGIITIGSAGTGKQISIIGPNYIHNQWSMLGFDPKAESAATTGPFREQFRGEVFYLDPFGRLAQIGCHKFRRAAFNALAGIAESDDMADECASRAAAIILPEGKDPHWAESARNVTTGVIGFACTTPGETPTLARVNALLNLPPRELATLWAEMSRSPHEFIRHAARPFLGEESGETRSILNTARTQLGTFLAPKGIQEALSGDDFRWEDLKRRCITVYVILPEDKAKDYHRFTRLIYASALRSLMKAQGEPVLIICDELATSLSNGQMDLIDTAFNLGRGCGVRLHVFLQNWPQAKAIFGERAESIESGAGVVQYFQASDPVTMEKMRARGGTWTEWVSTVSISDSNNTSEGRAGQSHGHSVSIGKMAFKRDLITPEIAYQGLGRPSGANDFTAQSVLIFEELNAPVLALRRGYWTMDIGKYFAPNPYVRKGRR